MRGGETGVTLGPVSGVVAVRSYLKLTALSCPRNSFILLPREEAVMSSMSLTPWGAPPQFPMGRRPFRTAPMSSDHRRCSIPRCKSKKGIRRSVDYHLRAPRRLCSKLGRRRWSTVDGGRAQGETELLHRGSVRVGSVRVRGSNAQATLVGMIGRLCCGRRCKRWWRRWFKW